VILELTVEQAETVRHALEVCLSDLRHEIVKTEKHEWKEAQHREEEVLDRMIKKFS